MPKRKQLTEGELLGPSQRFAYIRDMPSRKTKDGTKRIVEAIINDEKAILPISSYIDDEYNMDDVALSLPSLVGKDGLISHIPLELSKEEERKLNESYLSLKEVIKKLDL